MIKNKLRRVIFNFRQTKSARIADVASRTFGRIQRQMPYNKHINRIFNKGQDSFHGKKI